MYKFGLRIYFTEDGTIVYQTGYIMTSLEDYWQNNDPMIWHPGLNQRDDVQMIQYPWGKYFEEFSTMQLVRVNVETMEPVFEPWPEPEPIPPINEEPKDEQTK